MEITSHYPFVMYMMPPCFYWQLPQLEFDYSSVPKPEGLDQTESQENSKNLQISEKKNKKIAKSLSSRKKRLENDDEWKEKSTN